MKRIIATTLTMALMCSTAMAADTMTKSTTDTTSINNAPASSMSNDTMFKSNATGSSSNASMNSMAPASGNANIAAANIQALPEDGKMVRVMGTVKEVKGDNKFTLMDSTGTVKVKSSDTIRLSAGDKVTVTGKVDKGMMGTSIESAQVSKGFQTSMNDNMSGSSTGMTGGTISNGATMGRPMDSDSEATDNKNMENDNSQAVKPYTKNMSMNDYNSKNKTADKGQVNIQPEKGVMGDSNKMDSSTN